jgi:phage shock protein A
VLEDALSPGQSDLDRQIAQLTTSSGVDSDLEKMKAELGLGSGSADAAALPAGDGTAAAGSEPAAAEGDANPKEANP